MSRVIWRRKDEVYEEVSPEEQEEAAREWAEWEATPEGQEVMAESRAHIESQRANADRLSNNVAFKDLPLHFARGVQSIWDETGESCTMDEAGTRAGMDSDEYIVAAAMAVIHGLVRHPAHPDNPNLEASNRFMPGIG